MHKGDYRLKDIAEAVEQGLLDKKQAARYLNISVATLNRHLHNNARVPNNRLLRYVKIGSLVRFRLEDLQAYVAQNVHGG